jgi:hypothetical protein
VFVEHAPDEALDLLAAIGIVRILGLSRRGRQRWDGQQDECDAVDAKGARKGGERQAVHGPSR